MLYVSQLLLWAALSSANGLADGGPAQSSCAAGSDAAAVTHVVLAGVGATDVSVFPDAPGVPQVLESDKDGDYTPSALGEQSEFWRKEWMGAPPEPTLIHRWYAGAPQSAAQCFPELKHIAANSSNAPLPAPSTAIPNAYGLRMSYPVFDQSGSRAIVLVDAYALKGIGGSTQLWLVGREGKQWKMIGKRIVAVS